MWYRDPNVETQCISYVSNVQSMVKQLAIFHKKIVYLESDMYSPLGCPNLYVVLYSIPKTPLKLV